VMVIGGGPAGMEAARVCAECGYDVSLCEKSALGGLLDFAEMVKGKHESLSRLKNYLSHVLEVEGVNVVTGKEVDAAFAHEEKPDVVIVSTGSKRPGLAASGSSATPVIGVTDSLSAEIGNKVFFVDGDKLAACFDANVGSDTIEEMAKAKPWYAVIRDSSMADDATHANYEELFRTYSPDTVPQVI
ncbi:MAG: FAD-dependent oxidoreductase, partial [Eggerthella lenta]